MHYTFNVGHLSSSPSRVTINNGSNNLFNLNMETRTKWTREEDAVLLEEVRKSPENLTEAFRRTTRLLNGKRTFDSVFSRYYWMKKRGVEMFTLSSGPVTVVNTKNVLRKTVSVEEMTASELCTILILKLQSKKHCLENMIEGLESFLKYKEEL